MLFRSIIVDRGSILGVGRIGDLRQHWRNRFRVRWRGEGAAFVTSLRDSGVSVEESPRAEQVLVDVPVGWNNGRFFELASQHGITLSDVVPEEEDLQQLYHRLISS